MREPRSRARPSGLPDTCGSQSLTPAAREPTPGSLARVFFWPFPTSLPKNIRPSRNGGQPQNETSTPTTTRIQGHDRSACFSGMAEKQEGEWYYFLNWYQERPPRKFYWYVGIERKASVEGNYLMNTLIIPHHWYLSRPRKAANLPFAAHQHQLTRPAPPTNRILEITAHPPSEQVNGEA